MSAKLELSAKQRRVALDVLPRDRLGQIAERFELEMADRRVAVNHADAARRVEFAKLLGLLRRDELQAMCTALGRDTGGARKAGVHLPHPGRRRRNERQGQREVDGGHRRQGDRERWSFASVAALDLGPNGNLMRERFEGYRSEAADILRGSFVRSDSKNAQRTDEDESP